jgi:hypothetical protein
VRDDEEDKMSPHNMFSFVFFSRKRRPAKSLYIEVEV